jgi:hypothetical protein
MKATVTILALFLMMNAPFMKTTSVATYALYISYILGTRKDDR